MNLIHRRLPIGFDDFKIVRQNYTFIDKTRFIVGILEKRDAVTLITRPRRFGKTLNLSMLYYFLTLKDGEENRSLFAGLDIEKKFPQYMSYQGSCPVIFLTFKDFDVDTYESMLELLGCTMQDLYVEHKYILADSSFDEEYLEYVQKMQKAKGSEIDLSLSLKRLTSFLRKYYQKNVVILIDEYDKPIQSAWKYGYYEKCISFMRKFLGSALKSNVFLDFSVITGVTRVSKESIFSGLNNFSVYSVLSEEYSDIFGFTKAEVRSLIECFSTEEKFSEVEEWYDGYRFGSCEMFNPWSILAYLKQGCFADTYWINTSDNLILRDSMQSVTEETRIQIESLLLGESIQCILEENSTYRDVVVRQDALWALLVMSGYLKVLRRWRENASWFSDVQIPNLEIRDTYEREIVQFLEEQGRIDRFRLEKIAKALYSGNGEIVEKTLENILMETVSFFDMKKGREDLYHAFLLGLFVFLNKQFRILSNRESGHGRFDIAFFPIHVDSKSPGILIEIKSVTSPRKLHHAAEDALGQIEKNKYYTEFQVQGIENIVQYGIAFAKKNVCVLVKKQHI